MEIHEISTGMLTGVRGLMKRLRLHVRCRISNMGEKNRLISVKGAILCALLALSCLLSASHAADGLLGKWRALDQNNITFGFPFLPELKFTEDGNLLAGGLTYGYKIIDDGKFSWAMGSGIEKVYKYQISEDILMIYSLQAPDNRARFKRVK
jgi:hypothetical protein